MASVVSDRAGPDTSGLAGLDAIALARLVRDGRATASDVAQAHLTRAADVGRRVAAFAVRDPERVLAEAAGVDVRPGRFALPLAGVPVAVDDDVAVSGFPTSPGGEPALRDDLLVRRLRAAGAVVVGMTHAPDLGVPGPDPRLGCGGGPVAVVAGMAAVALGVDGAGTVRLAAARHGLVALKPGRGAAPVPGGADERWFGLAEAACAGRTAADVALTFEMVADTTIGDLAAVGIPRRVAVSARPPGSGPIVCADDTAVRIAARRLAEHGVAAVEADPPYPGGLRREWTRRWQAGLARQLAGAEPRVLPPAAAAAVRRGRRELRGGPPRGTVAAGWRDGLTGWLDGGRYDVLVLPAAGPAGRRRDPGHLTAWNLAGLPAVVVPVAWGAARVPVQLVGRPGSEPLLLATAACLER